MASKKRTVSLNLSLLVVFISLMIAVRPTAAEIASVKTQVQDPVLTPKEERELDDQIPKHLPIRVKIKKGKEESFKDLNNENWLRDFELELQNVGDKPIFFLSLIFSMPDVKAPDGNEYGFSLRFGRGDLFSFSTPVTSEDLPLKVGETYVFKIPDHLMKGWETFSRVENKTKLRPKKALIRLNLINFGDGTGFMGTTGIPIPNRPPQGKLLKPLESG